MIRDQETRHLLPDTIARCGRPSRFPDYGRSGLTMEEAVPALMQQIRVAKSSVREVRA